MSTTGGTGSYTAFQNGVVFTSTATGAHAVIGDIATAWARNGNELGPLGWPTTDRKRTTTGDGWYVTFQNGVITSSVDTGAHAVTGAIATAWARDGREAGPLGYPTTDAALDADGNQRVDFQHGYAVQAVGGTVKITVTD